VSTPILHLHKYIVSFFLKNVEHILEPFLSFLSFQMTRSTCLLITHITGQV